MRRAENEGERDWGFDAGDRVDCFPFGIFHSTVFPAVSVAVQEKHRGTADAVWQAIWQGAYPKNGATDYVIVLMGDQPLVTSDDLDEFIESFATADRQYRAGIMTFLGNRSKEEFMKCGVVTREKGRRFADLKALIPRTRPGKEELHAGPYVIQAGWLRGILTMADKAMSRFPENAPEYQLYDVLIASREDTGVFVHRSGHPRDFLGVDTIPALEEVRRRMARRIK